MNAFFLEKKLKNEDPDLHHRMSDSIVVLRRMLESFIVRFPNFTDHSILHSLEVIDFCNRILGEEQVEKLRPEECYVLLMGCYLHDVGMGISGKDFEEFSRELGLGESFAAGDRADEAETVRSLHNEYSGLFIRKYADLFDIPDEGLVRAIVQVSRGHRKTDLFDSDEFGDIPVPGGAIRTAYLAAVLRLADEIDVASARNPELLYDSSRLTEDNDIAVFGTHESIRDVGVERDAVVLYTQPKSPEFVPLIEELAEKIQTTLDYCRDVAEKCSDLKILQTQVLIRPVR